MNFGKQQTVAGIVAIVSSVLALACMITGMIALDYDFDAFSDPMLILNMRNVNVSAARWSMVLICLAIIFFCYPWSFCFTGG